ncbi:UDP-N-acetylmuramyl pentapeptide phosphotransferase [Paenisporosarcina quisquiliarum]|uniref:UDP-N-acetylmuramyl pentapeptide phosphotransferase n=1 Tax=Paenisporosarcina quisquiliarum TaxID=365346 RepID=A0A9X3LDL2_9BACL|nr:UDP-N-acetylmuramyl pentapeptide phosphotransferase [Paenisporosarcina quisquiliarum]MCZ8535991.1 UDP-N-acetylmuramyl pentapeptide phosphotransferase [Paenisporosarcina quisquiliarum]
MFIGSVLIASLTKITQIFKLPRIWELLGQISASLIIIKVGKLDISLLNLTYGGQIELGYLSIPFSLLFLVGFTNVMNMEKVQNHLILLLPCVSLVSLSILAFIMGDSFVSLAGICTCLTIIIILLYGYFSRKDFVGRTITSSIGFIIASLSFALLQISIVTIYIPIFTLALPFALYYLIHNKFTIIQSITISFLIAILFSVIIFVVPDYILGYLVVGLTIILVITQLSRRYRFI